ncbi:hypothetical protein Aple_101130 [Acrocarpospora pleiomorpha]|uniref:G domain-containing protein n=1 Tax=Acrocarpospora pleiomorpha TaxID=90975 RepID=A0A5M3Y1M8_9ACTN|nr:hypothetical protein [Acrocarpospora pleiomorpha]GES27214.1 hypothetical protein Aple_101130 [Acrocarpospora pleiomorpha]
MSQQDEAVKTILGADALNVPLDDGPAPNVVFFGPYNGGKSSTLKRLLIEDGTPVPDWLSVGPQPETFEGNRVESGGLVYWDTPGRSGRSAEHERIASETLFYADFVLLLVPPGRGDDDTGHLMLLAEAGFTAENTLVVLARCDQVGGDPVLAPEPFRASVEARKAALRKLLPEPLADAEVIAIAADPFGLVGNRNPDGPNPYSDSRSWDGMAELRAVLHALPDALSRLRAANRRRFQRAVLAMARRSAEEQLSQAREVVEEGEERRERADLLEQQLTELDAAAEVALSAAVSRELQAVVRIAGGLGAEEVRAATESRLQTALSAWDRMWNDRLAELAGKAQHDMEKQALRLSSIVFDDWADRLRAAPAKSSPVIRISEETLQRFRGPLALIAKGVVKMRVSSSAPLDETLKVAKDISDQREKLEDGYAKFIAFLSSIREGAVAEKETNPRALIRILWADSTQAKLDEAHQKRLSDLLARSKFFKTFKDVDRAKRWIKGLDIIGEFAPAAISLGGIVGDVWSDKRAQRADQERRRKDAEKITKITAGFTTQLLGRGGAADGTWEAAVQSLRAHLATDPDEEAVAAARTRITELERALADL